MKIWKVSMSNNFVPAPTNIRYVKAKTLLHAMVIAGKLRIKYYPNFTIFNIERVAG